jgi:TolB-like protein/DNA-binding winged helix-turn-helix (wHTH) protein
VAITVYEFGDFKLDCDGFELRRAGRALKLERKPMELLILLAERNGQLISRAEIAERLWDSEVFVDTEHGINTAIRKIRQVLGDDPEQPRYVQTVTGKGYRLIAPIAAIQSPSNGKQPLPFPANSHSASTNGHVAEESQGSPPLASPLLASPLMDTHPPVAGKTRWSPIAIWLTATAAAAVLALILVLPGIRARGSGNRLAQLPIKSLAVLPLDNLSGNPAQDYFADGMTDELTTMLARDSTLRIVSRTSAMQYKGVHKPLRKIAQALGVDGIVEGSVERTGDKVHMTLQLIQGPSDTHVWADSYDRDANDLVSLPNEAAMAIAGRTNSAVSARAPVHYVNPEAHDAYLHGRYLWFAGSNEEAGKYFKKAVQLQPDYALAWSGVADYYNVGMLAGAMDPRQGRQPAEAAAQRAVELDDSLPEAHNSLCAEFFFGRWDLARADQECVRAIELDPKFAEAYHLRAKVLSAMGRNQEAIASQKKAMEIDPFARPWGLAYIYLIARQYDAALTEGRQRLESDPHNSGILYILAAILSM